MAVGRWGDGSSRPPPQIGAASLGGQTQLLGSLAAAPVIANTIPSVQSIAGQLLTNAQGQVALPRGGRGGVGVRGGVGSMG